MLETAVFAENDTNADWAERSNFWSQSIDAGRQKRRLRQRNPSPLILCGHGISMRIENDSLVIRDGFTHYPQQQSKYQYFSGDLELPTRILLLDGSGTLSFNVLSWLAEQGVALARVKWTGEVATVASGSGYSADRDKLAWQHKIRADNAQRLAYAADLIRQKITSSITTLQSDISASHLQCIAISKARAGIDRLTVETFNNLNEIFAIEGECASAYFAAWNGLPIAWTGTTRRPVPESWRTFSGRSSLATGVKAENRNASHPVNALLNYACAVKLAQMQIQAIADGYDPTLGVVHNGRRGKPAFILDLIEPQRPIVDSLVLKLVSGRRFAAADFILRTDGVCRLSPQLARMVATAVSAARAADTTALASGRLNAQFKETTAS